MLAVAPPALEGRATFNGLLDAFADASHARRPDGGPLTVSLHFADAEEAVAPRPRDAEVPGRDVECIDLAIAHALPRNGAPTRRASG